MTNPINDPEQRLADDFRHVVESAYQDMAGVATGRKEYHLRHDELTSHLVQAAKAYAREREAVADRKSLETIAALLNGDHNQVAVVEGYVRNKLSMLQAQ